MIRFNLRIFLLILALPVVAQAQSQWMTTSGWNQPIYLGALAAGHYRIQMAPGDPQPEIVLERSTDKTTWTVEAALTAPLSDDSASIDFQTDNATSWRIRPLVPILAAETLTLEHLAFGAFIDSLRQQISPEPAVLRIVAEGPIVQGPLSVTAATGAKGDLWAAWIVGQQVHVWAADSNAELLPWTPPVQVSGPLTLVLAPQLRLAVNTGSGRIGAVWSGTQWVDDPAPPPLTIMAPLGTFSVQGSPPQVFQQTDAGWKNLDFPSDATLQCLFLAPGTSGVWVAGVGGQQQWKSWSLWSSQWGWQARQIPSFANAQGTLWGLAANSDGVFALTSNQKQWSLSQSDGTNWRPSLNLATLTPNPVIVGSLVPPSQPSDTGLVVLISDRIRLYALP